MKRGTLRGVQSDAIRNYPHKEPFMHSNPTQPAIEPNQRIVALDVHCKFTELAAVSPAGKRIASQRCNTTIPDVLAALKKSKSPEPSSSKKDRSPTGSCGLTECGECVRICDPRRNALVAKDDEKDDPIDALKLAQPRARRIPQVRAPPRELRARHFQTGASRSITTASATASAKPIA
ncbi:MAG: hypothetical protein IPM64_02250 [Phycisphaerales bacterium]|nr:hypothetical protein [Phycisphaerales bacterium]